MRRGIVFIVPLVFVIPAAAEKVALDECKQVADKLQSELPMKISSHSTLEKVACVPGKSKPKLVYNNRVHAEVKKPPPEVVERLKMEQRKAWCADADQRRFLEIVDISYAYYDASDRYLGALTHRIADCAK